MNNSYDNGVRERNIVYICKVHGGQLKSGDKNYSDIEETLQINLNSKSCNEKELIERYYIMNKDGKKLSEKLRIDIVDIAKANKKMYNKSEEKLGRFLRALTSLSIKEIEKELGEDVMEKESKDKLLEEVERYNEDEEIAILYSDYTKLERQKNTMIKEAQKEGLEKGLQEGLEKGREERTKEIVKKMLEDNVNVETISKYTNLAIKEIEDLK